MGSKLQPNKRTREINKDVDYPLNKARSRVGQQRQVFDQFIREFVFGEFKQ